MYASSSLGRNRCPGSISVRLQATPWNRDSIGRPIDLLREADRGKTSLLVLLDISVAFDTIDHGILLGRLSELGIGDLTLAWLRSFLEGRPQRVQLGENVSAPWSLNCGVPQGSIISPMLFNIYMRPLGRVIRGCGASCHQYADDTQLYISFSPTARDAVPVSYTHLTLPTKA